MHEPAPTSKAAARQSVSVGNPLSAGDRFTSPDRRPPASELARPTGFLRALGAKIRLPGAIVTSLMFLSHRPSELSQRWSPLRHYSGRVIGCADGPRWRGKCCARCRSPIRRSYGSHASGRLDLIWISAQTPRERWAWLHGGGRGGALLTSGSTRLSQTRLNELAADYNNGSEHIGLSRPMAK